MSKEIKNREYRKKKQEKETVERTKGKEIEEERKRKDTERKGNNEEKQGKKRNGDYVRRKTGKKRNRKRDKNLMIVPPALQLHEGCVVTLKAGVKREKTVDVLSLIIIIITKLRRDTEKHI